MALSLTGNERRLRRLEEITGKAAQLSKQTVEPRPCRGGHQEHRAAPQPTFGDLVLGEQVALVRHQPRPILRLAWRGLGAVRVGASFGDPEDEICFCRASTCTADPLLFD